MTRRPASDLSRGHRLLRLETLLRLRWYTVAAQAALVLIAQFAFGLELPMAAIAMVLALAVAFNLALHVRIPAQYRMEESTAFVLLGADVLQLAALLYFAGGIRNPFSIFFLAPVLFSATALPPRRTLALGLLAAAASSFILPFHQPLAWFGGTTPELPAYFVLWWWLALQACILFVGAYAWRIAEEARQLAQALATTELLLAREQHLSDLDGLAAAAAHELGTPLATIALVAGELLHGEIRDEAQRADFLLIKEQAARCRQILAQIADLGEPNAAPFRTVPVSDLLAEVIRRHHDCGAPILLERDGPEPEPRCLRNPALLYGIGNIVQNAAEFAASEVRARLSWNERRVTIEISDDGPGIPDFVVARLGEPYITARASRSPADGDAGHGGLGLGLFIAKVLLERSGATLEVVRTPEGQRGATMRLAWERSRFENVERDREVDSRAPMDGSVIAQR